MGRNGSRRRSRRSTAARTAFVPPPTAPRRGASDNVKGAKSSRRVTRVGTAIAYGDVDGDGLTDIAVGAPDEGVSRATATPASVHVICGRTAGVEGRSSHDVLTQAGSASRGSNEPDDHFGGAVAFGDFDGDGYDDLVVGGAGRGRSAPAWPTQEPSTVLYGTPSRADFASTPRVFDQGEAGGPVGSGPQRFGGSPSRRGRLQRRRASMISPWARRAPTSPASAAPAAVAVLSTAARPASPEEQRRSSGFDPDHGAVPGDNGVDDGFGSASRRRRLQRRRRATTSPSASPGRERRERSQCRRRW